MYTSFLRSAVIAVLSILCGISSQAWAGAPSVTTQAASGISAASVVLNGSGNPSGEATTGRFRYSSTNPVTCNDSFGTRVPAAGGTDLGMGTTSVAYSITTTGLTPGVTYYFCAIASNATGDAFGAVLPFTIPAPPVVLTTGAASVTSSSATLRGSANPVAATTSGWFRYATTNPGTCNDTFGTRMPSSGGTSLGAGTGSIDYSNGVTGLLPGTTYYYCAVASNVHGTSTGAVMFFTTLATAPAVSTSSATALSSSGATLNGSANPNGDATTAWFRYSTTSPGTCNDTFGTRAPLSGGAMLGSGAATTPYAQAITGLSPLTTYYYCAIAKNSIGTTVGAVGSFFTSAAPSVSTSSPSSITSTAAILNGVGTPNRAATTAWFRYSTTRPAACDDTFGTRAPATGGTALGAGTGGVAFAQSISGLTMGTTYYYCAIASNSEGTSFGALVAFSTLAAPAVTTLTATLVSSSSATINGSANPNGGSTIGWFRYATVSPGTCNDTFGTRAPSSSGTALGAGTSNVAFAQAIAGLVPGTTYYYCAIATNSYGTGFGAVFSFTTPVAKPVVTTSSASALTGTSATLNGSANPGGDATTGWFRFATVSPGTCNDTFGTRAPTTGGTSLGSGTTAAAFNQAIMGLTAGTTYYYCAIAANSVGTGVGGVASFTTPAAPTVTSTGANGLSNTSATLNGAAISNRAAATGWFRDPDIGEFQRTGA